MKFSWSLLWIKVSIDVAKVEKDNPISNFKNDWPFYRDKTWTYPSTELIRFKKSFGNIKMNDGIYTVKNEFWSPSISWGWNIWRVWQDITIKDNLIFCTYKENWTDYYWLIPRSFDPKDVTIKSITK